jgi:hypothetical protein
LLLYSSKPSLGVFQLAGHLLQANKFSGTIITAPSTSFLAPLPGTEEEEAPISNTHSPVNLAPSNAINSMTGRPLSRAGNEVWLKTVIQAIPNFVMSCFELPLATCDDIRRLIANIWWGIEEGKKKMH